MQISRPTPERFDEALPLPRDADIAVYGDEIAGVSVNFPKRMGDWGWIGSIGARRTWRRRGLGRALLRESLRRFRDTGESVVALGVTPTTRPAPCGSTSTRGCASSGAPASGRRSCAHMGERVNLRVPTLADAWGGIDQPYDDFVHDWSVLRFDPTLWFLAEEGSELVGMTVTRRSVTLERPA